jgi:glucose-1-phosphate thymidylyltransferase
MKVIIPLAGFGTRLRPLTFTKPKPLINVAGKPVLAHILDSLAGLDVEEMVFIVGHLGDQIQEYVSAHYDFQARYVEQKELKGQAHALHLAREYLTGPILIVFVDTIFAADLQHLPTDCDGVLYVKEVDDPRRFGVAIIENGIITRLVEKPTEPVSNLAVIGVYYIRQGERLLAAIEELLHRDIKTKGEYFLADALQLMIGGGARFRAVTVDVWEDCGKPETVLQTNRYLLDKTGGYVGNAEDTVIVPPVYIADSARVVQSVVGPYVTIADGAVVQRSIVKDSIIDKGAHIEDATLQTSLIGENARVRGACEQLNVGDSSLVDFTGNGYDE